MSAWCFACRKPPYATFDDGTAAAVRKSARDGHAVRVYKCPAGNGWHLTRWASAPKPAARPA